MSEKIKILMVDDEEDLLFMVKENLEENGAYQVITSSNPIEIEALIHQHAPNLILLDIVMPKRKGTEIIKSLKSNPATKKIPIIILSGKGEMVYNKKKNEFSWMPNSPLVKQRGEMPSIKGAEGLAEYYNVDDYLSKPFSTEFLLEVIQGVMSKVSRSETPGPEEESAI